MIKTNEDNGLIKYVAIMVILTISLGIVAACIYNPSVSEDYTEITGVYKSWDYETEERGDAKVFKIDGEGISLNYTGNPDDVLTGGKTYTFYIDENNYLVKWKEW